MSKQKHAETTPVIYGDMIPDTHLRRRYQGQRQVCPEYFSDDALPNGWHGHVDRAIVETQDAGFSAVIMQGITYALVGGEWCCL